MGGNAEKFEFVLKVLGKQARKHVVSDFQTNVFDILELELVMPNRYLMQRLT